MRWRLGAGTEDPGIATGEDREGRRARAGTLEATAPLSGMAKTPGKKPPAPSVTERRTKSDIKAQIVAEIVIALERLGADQKHHGIAGNRREALTDEEVLAALREHNARRRLQ
jgi:hypothetical protein